METMQEKRSFNRRAFTSIAMLISGLILPISGIMNHELGKAGFSQELHLWMSVHNSAATLFVLFATAHLILNWKALIRHAKAVKDRVVSKEALAAVILVAGVVGIFSSHALHAR